MQETLEHVTLPSAGPSGRGLAANKAVGLVISDDPEGIVLESDADIDAFFAKLVDENLSQP